MQHSQGNTDQPPLPIRGVIQHYDWGGTRYLPRLLGRQNEDDEPWAELWLGAHPKGPARLVDRADADLRTAIDQAPEELLGENVARAYDNQLPFLLKVLDVKKMLSIQVHPPRTAARAGFEREERAGVSRSAPDRNYRDANHKPELGVALTDFYLLHGFRESSAIRETLDSVPGWSALLPHLERGGTEGLYAHIMTLDQDAVDRLLSPLVDRLVPGSFEKNDPNFWAQRAVEQYSSEGHHDRGMFSIYWFNLVHLRPGAGIFQDAGIPHAYLEGVCVELMANSDNVLRGGLTPKHIDVDELLKQTSFTAVRPTLLSPVKDATEGWQRYPTPAPDFALYTATLSSGDSLDQPHEGPGVLFVLRGTVTDIDSGQMYGETLRSAFIPAGTVVSLVAEERSVLYLAAVGNETT